MKQADGMFCRDLYTTGLPLSFHFIYIFFFLFQIGSSSQHWQGPWFSMLKETFDFLLLVTSIYNFLPRIFSIRLYYKVWQSVDISGPDEWFYSVSLEISSIIKQIRVFTPKFFFKHHVLFLLMWFMSII